MYKYVWIVFILLSSYKSYAATCEDVMGGSLDKMNSIRTSMNIEQNLLAQGFSKNYTNQFDTAFQMVELRKHWIEKKADPENTHIPYFSQEVPSHIEMVRKEIEASTLTNDEKYERLRILKKLEDEAYFMRKTYKVNSTWWNIFNIRLMALTVPVVPSAFNLGFSQSEITDYKIVYERLQETKDLVGIFGARYVEMMNRFPEIVLVPVIGDVGLMAFNQTAGENVHFLRISSTENGKMLTSQTRLRYDLQRAASMEEFFKSEDLSFHSWFKQRMQNLPQKEREQQEFAYYILMFERGNMRGDDNDIFERNFHRMKKPSTDLINMLPPDVRDREYQNQEAYTQALHKFFNDISNHYNTSSQREEEETTY